LDFDFDSIPAECILTDLNNDEILSVLDLITMVNIILDLADNNILGDMNGDFGINILDLTILINLILNN
jgi:hypothetical protein